jgi:hypothetical protein
MYLILQDSKKVKQVAHCPGFSQLSYHIFEVLLLFQVNPIVGMFFEEIEQVIDA